MKRLFIILLSIFSISAFGQTDKLMRQIALELGKVEGNLPQINILAKNGEKAQARAMIEEALLQIEKIEGYQQQLALLDETLDEEALMIAEVRETKQLLISRANKLRYTAIYIHYDAFLFDSEYSALLHEVQGALSEENVAFVDSIEKSDWSVSIIAKAREYNKTDFGGIYSYFSYVDVKTVIQKTANGKRIYENTFTEKGGSPISYEQAAREAYKYLAPRVSAIIKEQIEK